MLLHSRYGLQKQIVSRRVGVALFFVVLSFLIFGNGIAGDFVLDDTVIVERRSELRSLTSVPELFVSPYHQNEPRTGLYRPLTMTSFALNNVLFGRSPAWFHVINIILHAVNVVLVFWFTRYLTRKRIVAYISALLFLSLPIHIDAVTSIVGRTELLAFMFGMLAMYFTIQKKLYLSAVLFLGALFAKEHAVIFPIIIGFIGVGKLGWNARELLRRMGVFAGAFIFYFLLRWIALGNYVLGSISPSFVENPLAHISMSERLATSLGVTWLYVQKIFIPISLSADYSYDSIQLLRFWPLSWETIFGVSIICVLGSLVYFKRTRFSLIGVGSFIFLVPYLLVSNIIFPIGTIMGERLMYLPSLGLVLIVAYLIGSMWEWKKFYGKSMAILVLAILFSVYSVVTIIQNPDWRSNNTLMTAVVREYPNNVSARTALAAIAISNEDWDSARVRIDTTVLVYEEHSPLFNLRGIIAEYDGDAIAAEQHYLSSLELNPNAINSHMNLANLYSRQDRHVDALSHWKVVAEFGHVPDHVIKYAHTLVLVGDSNEAIDALGLAFDTFNTDVNASTIAGIAYAQKGEYIKALLYLKRAKVLGNIDPNIDSILKAIEAKNRDQ